MMPTATAIDLEAILKAVSRSFFLTLRVAPRVLRPGLGIGYLFCRAADTIADTRLLSPEARLDCLARYRAQFEAPVPDLMEIAAIARAVGGPREIPEEQQLLVRLAECFRFYLTLDAGDRDRLRRLVTTLTRGMEMDLTWFPAEESGRLRAFETDAQLDLYTYHVAGCVGEFWTELQVAHLPALRDWDLPRMRDQGTRFGKGLQMTNILRDVNKDLGMGRCYFPLTSLEAAGLSVGDMRSAEGRRGLRPVLRYHLERTLDLYRAGWEYVLAIPRRLFRLRLACSWPLLIGLETLSRLASSEDPYRDHTQHKITRPEVYRVMRGSALRALSNRSLDGLYRRLESRLVEAVERLPKLARLPGRPR